MFLASVSDTLSSGMEWTMATLASLAPWHVLPSFLRSAPQLAHMS